MAATLWQWRLILICHVNANTLSNRNALAQVFVDNGSGESLADETKMFGNAIRLALTATPTVHRAYGISFPVKANMRDALLTVIQQIDAPLTAAQKSVYYGVANVDGAIWQGQAYNEDVCFYANRAADADFVGTILKPRDVLTRLGLVVYQDA